MSYLAQIAARNTRMDQAMVAPVYSSVERPADDPFDRSAFAAPAPAIPQPEEGIRPAATTSSPSGNDVPGLVLPVHEQQPAATTPAALKTVYLSQYTNRNKKAGMRDASYKSSNQSQSSHSVAGSGFEHKASPLLPAPTRLPAKSVMESQATKGAEISHVQQPATDKESHVHQQPILLQPTGSIKESASLTPIPAVTKIPAAPPVFLQPHVQTPSQALPQKEKPQPSLVIGKITVEIVPAQKPVNKIIHQVVKSQPSPPAAPRSKSGFGLGQL